MPTSLRWFDQVVLVSPSQLPFFREHVDEERLSVILHGVDTDFFCPTSRSNGSDRLRCITVGHWLRDWETFAAVAGAMPDVQFDVVVNRDLAIQDLPNVQVHRSIDDLELVNLYRAADILFLPLLQSTANNALLEGMASGLAVVATDLEAVRAYVPDGDGLLLPGRADDFVDAIRTLQRNPTLREELRRKARARVRSARVAPPGALLRSALFESCAELSRRATWSRAVTLGRWTTIAHLVSNIMIANGQEMSDLINRADRPKQSPHSIEM